MPSVTLHTPSTVAPPPPIQPTTPLPQLLHTPLGLALLDIQGSLHLPPLIPSPSHSSSPTKTQICRLEFPLLASSSSAQQEQEETKKEGPWMKKVWLYVGERQKLVGEVKRLERAVGVLRKREESGTEEVEIADIIRFVLLFRGRPEFV